MSSYSDFSRMITFLSSLVICFGLYAQCYKVFCTKSAKDFTPILVISLLLSEAAWLNYGLVIQEWPITIISSLNMVPVTLISIGYWRYR